MSETQNPEGNERESADTSIVDFDKVLRNVESAVDALSICDAAYRQKGLNPHSGKPLYPGSDQPSEIIPMTEEEKIEETLRRR